MCSLQLQLIEHLLFFFTAPEIMKTTSSFFPQEDSYHEKRHSMIFNNAQSNHSLSHHLQFLPCQQFSTKPSLSTNLLSYPSKASKNSLNLIKNASFPMNSTRMKNNNLILSLNASSTTLAVPSTLSSSYYPETSYSHLSKHFIWNTNLFYTQTKSAQAKSNNNDNLLEYPATFGNILNQTQYDQNYTENRYDQIFSSCPEGNSDDSIDINERDKETQNIPVSKKRNPYSIEELLKKPEKNASCSLNTTKRKYEHFFS